MQLLRNPDGAIGTLTLRISNILALDEDVVEFLHVHDDGWGRVLNRLSRMSRTAYVGLVLQPFQSGTCLWILRAR